MDLLRAARKGNPDALLKLFDEHHIPLFRFAYKLTGSVTDAEDVVQQCFLELLAPDCSYDPRRATLRTYLFGAARNLSLDRMRSRAAAVDGIPAVAEAVMRLPDSDREVLILAHYEQVPLADIGRALEIELPAVKSHLRHARASLKETLAEPDRLLNTWTTPDVPPSLRAGLVGRLPAPRTFRRPLRLIIAFALVASAGALVASVVRHGMLSSDAGPWDDHTYVRRTRIVQPHIAKLRWMFMGGRSTGWQWYEGKLVGSVYLYDRWSHAHYGYSWTAQPLGATQYLFTVLPLDPSVVKEQGPIVSAPIPPPALLAAGSSFEVNLYASSGERVYDRIELSAQPMSITGNPDPPHETVTMTLTNPKLYVNGRLAAAAGGATPTRGLTSLIDVPGRGRYVVALYRGGNPAFIQAGSVKGNALEFEWAGETFRVECSAPISPNGDRPIFAILQTRPTVTTFAFASGGAPNQYR
jgi:RNA polymerase sigma-70 factor (ECF subfamily)